MWQFLDNLHEFFFKSFWEKKCFWLLQKWRKFSDISAIFDGISGNFGLFLTRSKYRAFLGKVSRPMLLKFPSEFQIKYRAKYEISANMATLFIFFQKWREIWIQNGDFEKTIILMGFFFLFSSSYMSLSLVTLMTFY